MTARSFFVATDGRLHAPWRILVFLLIAGLCTLVALLIVSPIGGPLDHLVGQDLGVSESIAIIAGVLAAHAVMLRWIDRRSWAYVGLDRAAARRTTLLKAWLLGAGTIAAPSVLLFAAHWLAVVPSARGSWLASAVRVTVALIPAGFDEELMSRGYLFAAMREWLGWPSALLVTSVGFGVLHLWNPGANAMSVTMVTLAGVFLGAVLLATRSLYAAWMAHWSWNWVMAVPMHVAVSGLPLPYPDYRTIETGPDWITGGAWGPEGGVAAALGMGAGFVYLWRMKQRNERAQ